MFSNIIFLLQTLLIVSEYYILYLFKVDQQKRFENAIKQLGSINIFYIKIFQAISTNNFLLTEEQTDYLSRYTDDVPFMSNEIDPFFEMEINKISRRINDNFEINKQGEYLVPLKSGMVSLVYTGTLNGQRVAIKVLRKNIRKKLYDALNKIDFLFKIVGRWPYIRAFNVNELISENRNILIEQTDLKKEVKNINTIYKNCLFTDYVIIPKVYPEYTTEDSSFFVMDYLEGRKVNEITDDEKETYCLQLAKFGIKCILYNRVYHGDLHPGNILFMKDESNNLKIGIIDFGIIGELTRDEQNFYYKILKIMSNSSTYIDLATMVMNNLIEPKNTIKSLSKNKYDKLLTDLVIIFTNSISVNSSFKASVIYEINRLLRSYNVYLSKSFCKIQLCMAVSDSVINKLSNKTTYLDNIKQIVSNIESQL
tara:strand:- start:5088 stop:6359 length:1272 start_codon:yes stop_codon:yes gene_type:complete